MNVSSRMTVIVGCLVFVGSLVAGQAHGETVGHDLIGRATIDGANGAMFILDNPFTASDTISSFSIFQNAGRAGNRITPLLFTQVVPGDTSNWKIVGIGTTFSIFDSALRQDFPFGVVSGTDSVGPGTYFGWKDGGNGSNNNGTIEFDNDTTDNMFYLGGGHTSFAVDDEIPVNAGLPILPRTYSVQASTDLIAPQLELTIDRDTGGMTLANNTPGVEYAMVGYSITSDDGELDPGAWLSIAENYDVGNPGPDQVDSDDSWTELTDPAVRTDLSESQLGGPGPSDGALLASGQTIDLGNSWIQNLTEDVTATVLLDSGAKLPAFVSFSGNGGNSFGRSDLNFNGQVDIADWPIFSDGAQTDLTELSAAEAYQAGDLNGDGFNNILDSDLFIEDYEAAHGPGSFAAMVTSIPEPTASVLLALGGLVLLTRRRNILNGVRIHLGVAILLAVTWAAPSAVQAETIGQDLVSHPQHDTAAGSIFAFNGQSFSVSEDVTSWSIHSEVGGVVTPLIFELLGGEYIIRGIGTARTFDASGIQTFDFDVTAGSETVQPGYLLGWKDGADDDSTGTGVIDMEINGAATEDYQWFGGGHADDLTVGGNFGAGTNLIGTYNQLRDYSVQFSTGAIEQLTLEVNTTTGATRIVNDTTSIFDINSYEIATSAATLDAVGWRSFSDQDLDPVDGGDDIGEKWDEAGGSGSHVLAETFLLGSTVFDPTDYETLGRAFDPTVLGLEMEDASLEFRYRTKTGDIKAGAVTVTDWDDVSSVLGDYNGSNLVEQGDLDLVLLNWGKSWPPEVSGWVNQPPTDDGTIDQNDLDGVLLNWGNASSVATSAAVPEPSTLGLVGLMLVLCGRWARSVATHSRGRWPKQH